MQLPPPKKKVSKAKTWLRVRDIGALYFKKTKDTMPCCQTVRNWMRFGKVTYAGNHIKLESVRRHNVLLTTEAWLDLFIEEVRDEDF